MVNKNCFGVILVVLLFILVVVGSSVSAVSFDDLGLFGSGSFSGFFPNITDAYVEPTKVVPGDVMTVSAEVLDDYGIAYVTADMGDIETIPLFLEKGTVYDGLWQNEWLVHDTEVKDYNTTITAVNVLGASATRIVGWSDPVSNMWTVGVGGDEWSGNVTMDDVVEDSNGYIELNMTEFDSYDIGNYDGDIAVNAVGEGCGQAFTISGNHSLCRSKFYLKYLGTPDFKFKAKLYDCSGTVGTNAVPTGSAISESDEHNSSELTSSYQLINFTFSTPHNLLDSNDYCLHVEITEYTDGFLYAGYDSSSPTHIGNLFYNDGSYHGVSIYDTIFYIYEHTSQGNLTSIVKDAENITGGQTGDIWSKLTLEGQNTTSTWFHGYWNYSNDNLSFQLQDIGNLTSNQNYTLTNARYGSFIIEFNTNNLSNTSELYNVTLFSQQTGFSLIVTSPTSTTYTNKNITISGTTSGNANITYSLNGDANISVINNSDTFNSWDNTTVEGQNNITIYVVNSTNATDTDSETIYFTVDTTSSANITCVNSTQGEAWINLTWTNPSDIDYNHVEIYRNETWIANVSDPTEFYYDSGLNSSTVYNYSLRPVDGAGNKGNYTYYINSTLSDGTLPTIIIQSPSNTTYTQKWVWANVSLNEDGDWCSVSLNGTGNQTLTQLNATYYYLNLSVSGESSNNATFYCNDTLGNMNNSETVYFTIDTTPPAGVSNLANQSKGEIWIYWNWTNPTGDFNYTEVWLNGTFKENTSNNYYNATGLNTSAWYEIQTRTVDSVGNINATWVNSTAKTLDDQTPPIITFVSPTPNNWNTSDVWAYINITVNEPCVWSRLEWNGTTNETWDGNISDTNFYKNMTGLNGNYTFKAYCNDSAGNMELSETRWVNANVTQNITEGNATVTCTDKIYISNGWANIYTINEKVDDTSCIEQLESKVWLVKKPIMIESTGSLYINDTDCDWLKLLSLDDSNEAYIENQGILDMNHTKVTSWDSNTNTVAPRTDSTRAYIYSHGIQLLADSCNLSSLGYNSAFKYGIQLYLGSVGSIIKNTTMINNNRGLSIDEDGVQIINCEIYSSGVEYNNQEYFGIAIAYRANPISNLHFENVTIHDNYGPNFMTNYCPDNGSMINSTLIGVVSYNGVGNLITLRSTRNLIVRDCIAHDSGFGGDWHSGFDFHTWCDNITVENCTAWNCENAFYIHNMDTNITIRDSVAHDADGGFKIMGGCTNNKIENSTAYNINGGAFATHSSSDNEIENCTAYNSTYGTFFYPYNWTGGIMPWTEAYYSENNIYRGCNFSDNIGTYKFYPPGPGMSYRNKNYIYNQVEPSVSWIVSGEPTILYQYEDGRVFKTGSEYVPCYTNGSYKEWNVTGADTITSYDLYVMPNIEHVNVTINTYNSSFINFTATNSTSSQTMNLTVENGTFPITNGNQYSVKKDGATQDTQTASDDKVIFTGIDVGSDYTIQEEQGGGTQENSWTVGSGGDEWAGNVTTANTTLVRSTGNVELRQLVDDYVSYWRFDEGSGNIAHDENTTNNNNGTLKNGTATCSGGDCPVWNSSSRYGDYALQFDGDNDYVALTDFTNVAPTTEITMTAWIYTDILDASLFRDETAASDNRINVQFNGGIIYWDFGNSGATGRLSYTPPVAITGSWQYLTFISNSSGSFQRIYRNGILEASDATASTFTQYDGDLNIMRYSSTSFLNGSIDEVRIYNRSLSPSEINQTRDNSHHISGNLTSIVKDAENITDGQTSDVFTKIRIDGQNTSNTWFHSYWNYSSDNSSFQIQDLGNLTSGTNYTLTQARYGSFIIELNTDNLSLTPELYNITLFSQQTGFHLTVTSPTNTTYIDKNITILGTTSGNANISYSLNGNGNISVINDSASFNTWNDSTIEGQNNITIYAVNSTNSSDTNSETIYFTLDTIPPDTITTLNNQSQDENWIYWNWTNPTGDFDHVEVYLNNTHKINTSDNYYNATGLNASTWYEIQTRTVDNAGNINATWVNDTAKTLDDSTEPTYSNTGTNNTIANKSTKFYAYWQDTTGLSGFIFSTNNTGIWQNETWQPMTGIGNWSNFTKNLNATVDLTIGYIFYANDSSNNWNNTGIIILTTTSQPQGPSGCSAIGVATYNAGTNEITLNSGTSTLCTIYYDVDNQSALAYDTATDTYNLYANISIATGTTLVINDTNLIFDSSEPIQIYVSGCCGRTLNIHNSTITSTDGYGRFSVRGNINITDSELSNLGISANNIVYGQAQDSNSYYIIDNNTIKDSYHNFNAIDYHSLTKLRFTNNNVSNLLRNVVDFYNMNSDCYIANNIFTNTSRAPSIATTNAVVIPGYNCTTEYNVIDGFGDGTTSISAIIAKEMQTATHRHNTIKNGTAVTLGISAYYKYSSTSGLYIYVYNNTITNVETGIKTTGDSVSGKGPKVLVYNNTILNTQTGISIAAGTGVRDSLFYNNYINGSSSYNIDTGSGYIANVSIYNNTLGYASSYSMYLYGSANITVRDNLQQNTGTYDIAVRNLDSTTRIINHNDIYTYYYSGGVLNLYYYHDVNLTDKNGNPVSNAEIKITNEVATTYPAIDISMPPQKKTSFYTELNGHTSKPSENASNTIAVMAYWKTSSTDQNMTYNISAYDPNNIWTNITHMIYPNGTINQLQPLANISGIDPDESWYRSNPNTYQNTTTLQINYTKTNLTVNVSAEMNITINTYSSTTINFTATNSTSSQTMNITVENATFPITNGNQYSIKKDGATQATETASDNKVIFTGIDVGSDYTIQEEQGGGPSGCSAINAIEYNASENIIWLINQTSTLCTLYYDVNDISVLAYNSDTNTYTLSANISGKDGINADLSLEDATLVFNNTAADKKYRIKTWSDLVIGNMTIESIDSDYLWWIIAYAKNTAWSVSINDSDFSGGIVRINANPNSYTQTAPTYICNNVFHDTTNGEAVAEEGGYILSTGGHGATTQAYINNNTFENIKITGGVWSGIVRHWSPSNVSINGFYVYNCSVNNYGTTFFYGTTPDGKITEVINFGVKNFIGDGLSGKEYGNVKYADGTITNVSNRGIYLYHHYDFGNTNFWIWNVAIDGAVEGIGGRWGNDITADIYNVTINDTATTFKVYSNSVYYATNVLTTNYTTLCTPAGSGKLRIYELADIYIEDTDGNPVENATVTIKANEANATSISPINRNLTLLTQTETLSNGHTPLPNEDGNKTLALLRYQKSAFIDENYTYTISAYDPNNIWTNVTYTIYPNRTINQLQPLANVSGIDPDESWYRSNPNTYQNTTTLQINYTRTNITLNVSHTINITINTYSSSIINFTATNSTADQKMNITVGNSTFPIINENHYTIKKDGVTQDTQTASDNKVIFTNIAVGSEYIISTAGPNITNWQNNITGNQQLSITINETQSIYFNITVDQPVNYSWSLNNTDQSRNAPNYTYNNAQPGTYSVKVNISNENGTDSKTWALTVKDIPNINSVTESSDPISVNSIISIEANITDLDGDLEGKYAVIDNHWYAMQSNGQDKYLANYTPTEEKLYTYYIYANDTTGLSANTSADTFTAQQGPAVTIITITPSSGNETTNFIISANITDYNSIDKAYAKFIQPSIFQTELTNQTSDTYNTTYNSTTPGTYAFYIRANDTLGATTSTSTYSFTINDTIPPTIHTVETIPINKNETTVVNIEANVTDFNVSTVYANITGPKDSIRMLTGSNPYSNNTGSIPHKLGLYNVEIIAMDASGNNATFETNYTINDTQAPQLNTLSVIPSLGNININFTITANITDNDAINSTRANITKPAAGYDILMLIGSNPYSVNFTNTSWLGLYRVSIIANDSSGNTLYSFAYPLGIANFSIADTELPSINDLNVTPASINTTQEVTITANVTDDNAVNYVTANVTRPDSYPMLLTSFTNTSAIYRANFTETTIPGFYTLLFTVVDIAGNTSTALSNFTVNDTIAPVITLFNADDYTLGLDQKITFTITSNDNDIVNKITGSVNITKPDNTSIIAPVAEISYVEQGSPPVSVIVQGEANYTPDIVGNYTAILIIRDLANNTDESTITFEAFDTTGPAVTSINITAVDSQNITINIITDEAGNYTFVYDAGFGWNYASNSSFRLNHTITLPKYNANTTILYYIDLYDSYANPGRYPQAGVLNFTVEGLLEFNQTSINLNITERQSKTIQVELTNPTSIPINATFNKTRAWTTTQPSQYLNPLQTATINITLTPDDTSTGDWHVNETITAHGSAQDTFFINMTVFHACGDGDCDSGELCSTCSADCGVCAPDSPGGGSSGGGGGLPPVVRECENNSGCLGTQTCEDYTCVSIKCGYCEYAKDHDCKKYECCADSDCKEGQLCEDHKCVKVEINETSADGLEEKARKAISAAKYVILEYRVMRYTEEAENVLTEAQVVFESGDYERAIELADRAKALAESASIRVEDKEPPQDGFNWALALGIVLLFIITALSYLKRDAVRTFIGKYTKTSQWQKLRELEDYLNRVRPIITSMKNEKYEAKLLEIEGMKDEAERMLKDNSPLADEQIEMTVNVLIKLKKEVEAK